MRRRAPGGFPRLAGAGEAGGEVERLRPPSRCCWPLWRDFTRAPSPARFCDAPTVPRRAYCAEHADLAVRQRGEPWRKLPPPTLLGRILEAA